MVPDQRSKSQEIASLAEDLIADIELSRLEGDKLVFKALRLARLTDSDALIRWLLLELYGYDLHSDDPLVKERIVATGRSTAKTGLPFGDLWVYSRDCASQLEALRNTAREHGTWQKFDGQLDRAQLERQVRDVDPVLRRIVALLYDSALRIYHQIRFSGLAETIFERYKADVDARLAVSCADVLKKLPAVFDRLAEGDEEAIRQALTTCRSMIDAFADAVYPARSEPAMIDEKEVQVGQEHTRNRINVFIAKHVDVKVRRQRLRHALEGLYDRVCEGIHREVTPQEARALVLQTYLFLGEVIALDIQGTTETPESTDGRDDVTE